LRLFRSLMFFTVRLIYRYNRINKLHYLLPINSFYMFRTLIGHHQKVPYIQKLVNFLRIMSACCYQGWSGTRCTPTLVAASRNNTHKIYQICICSTFWWWVNKCWKHVQAINRNKLKPNSASCWSYHTEHLGTFTQQLEKNNYSFFIFAPVCETATTPPPSPARPSVLRQWTILLPSEKFSRNFILKCFTKFVDFLISFKFGKK
jgi:hypothetical protein